jgi:cytochrome P450
MQSFILFMISHPNIEKKVREEIDRVVGSERMPVFEDEPNLPYLVACIKEPLRRRPPTTMGKWVSTFIDTLGSDLLPLGIPHSSDEDDVYEGYFIPKGSTVIGNVWAIHMDPRHYPCVYNYS